MPDIETHQCLYLDSLEAGLVKIAMPEARLVYSDREDGTHVWLLIGSEADLDRAIKLLDYAPITSA